jgi:hypothetical protein
VAAAMVPKEDRFFSSSCNLQRFLVLSHRLCSSNLLKTMVEVENLTLMAAMIRQTKL